MHQGLKYLIKTYRPLKGSSALWVYAALGIGIASMVMLFRFSNRVEATVHKDARKFLAADFQIQARRKPTKEVLAAAEKIGQGKANLALQTDLLASAILPSGDPVTISLRALENPAYPFYGTLDLEPASLRVEDLRKSRDGNYGVFVDASMRERGIKLGDELGLGSIKITVLAFIKEEPQGVASAFAAGPRFIVHQEGLAASHLADYGAYAFYSLLIKSPLKLSQAQEILKEDVGEAHWRLISPQRANLQTQRVVSRLESFLLLIAFASFVLGGVGLFAIARFQILRNLGDWILFKALGLTRSDLIKFSVFWITLVALLSLVLGFALGFGFESLVTNFARKTLEVDLADIPLFTSLWNAVALSFGVSFIALGLPLLQVVSVSPNEAWSSSKTKSIDASSRVELWLSGAGVTVLSTLAFFDIISRSWLVALLWGAATWLGAMFVRKLAQVLSRRPGTVMRQYPFLWVHRSWSELRVLNYSVAAAIYLIVLVAIISATLRSQLQLGKSDSTPQAVALGVLESQKNEIKTTDEMKTKWVPTLQLRITSLKGEAVKMSELSDEGQPQDGDQRPTFSLTREYIVNARAEIEDNETLESGALEAKKLYSHKIVEGGGLRVSLEKEFADGLEVKPGDKLTVNIAGVELPARVDSLRSVQWFRFQPSFFIVVNPDDLPGAPLTYVGLFQHVKDLRALQKSIQTPFPNIAVIDSKSIADKLVVLIDRVIFAISSLGLFVFIAAVWVFAAVMISRRPAFRQDLFLVRLLGSSAWDLRELAFWHFAFLTIGTGLFSSVLAVISAWLVAKVIFDIPLFGAAVGYSLLGSLILSVLFAVAGYVISGPYAEWNSEAENSGWQAT